MRGIDTARLSELGCALVMLGTDDADRLEGFAQAHV
jgi:hypothetical protein